MKRIYYQNAIYHVIFRGNNRQNVLKFKSEKRDLLVSIKRYQERKDFKIYAFVIMDNHVHLLIETNEIHNISKIMQSILLSFSVKYRRKYDYVGHVWQGRFQSKPIVDQKYLIECINYIHMNPTKSGLVNKADEYPYSSARFYGGLKAKEVEDYIELTKYDRF
jgi:putative transposase